MNIEAKEFEIKMTHGELWSVAFDVKGQLVNTLKTHWINHQSSWKEREAPRLFIIRAMFYALGRPDLFDGIEREAEEIFKTYNDARK